MQQDVFSCLHCNGGKYINDPHAFLYVRSKGKALLDFILKVFIREKDPHLFYLKGDFFFS